MRELVISEKACLSYNWKATVNRYEEALDAARIQVRLGKEGIQAYSYKYSYWYSCPNTSFISANFNSVYKHLYTCLATLTFLVRFTKTAIITKNSFYNEGFQERKEDERKSDQWLKIMPH